MNSKINTEKKTSLLIELQNQARAMVIAQTMKQARMSKLYPNSVQYVEPTNFPDLQSQLNQAAITNYDEQKDILAAHLKSVGFYENNIIPNLSNLAVELMNSYWTDFVQYAQTVMKNSKLSKDKFIDIIHSFLKSKSPLYSYELKDRHLDAQNTAQAAKDAADVVRHNTEAAALAQRLADAEARRVADAALARREAAAEARRRAEALRLQQIEDLTKRNSGTKIARIASDKANRVRIEKARIEAERLADAALAALHPPVLPAPPVPDEPEPVATQRPALLNEYDSIFKDANGKASSFGGIVKTSAIRSIEEWATTASHAQLLAFASKYTNYKKKIRDGNDAYIYDMFLYRQSLEHPEAPQGTGLKKTRVYRGRGSSGEEETLHRYYVDTKRLNNGVLCVRYRKNHAVKMKPIEISQAVKECILDICNDRFSSRIYDTLSDEEKKIIYRFAKELNLPLDIKNESVENTFKEFEILKGEIVAGNDNPEVKRRLKICIHDLVMMKRMPQQRGLQILAEL